MNKKETALLKDMAAFIEDGIKDNKDFGFVAFNISHDINGIMTQKRCFKPRLEGYRKRNPRRS